MKPVPTKKNLSPERQRLVELMQRINFGRIDDLRIQCGEPVFDPPPRVYREIKIGAENGPRPEVSIGDFALKDKVAELFAHMEALGDGKVERLEVKHGLPFHLIVEEVIRV